MALVMRAVEGPLASVRSSRPETLEYEGLAEPLQIRLGGTPRSQIPRDVLDRVSIADLVSGKLPKGEVLAMTENPGGLGL